jgi:SAM-dependent methyltransferase
MRWPFSRQKSPGDALDRRLAELQRAAEFYPTPLSVARDMLEFAEVGPEDVVYDLGSGDGRIPILAAQEFGCRAVGIEIDPKLCRYSLDRVAELGLADRVTFEEIDLFKANLRPATVVTLYLLSCVNEHLQPRMASHLRPGARVVVLDYPIPGWRPEKTLPVRSIAEVEYTLYLYRRPKTPWSPNSAT